MAGTGTSPMTFSLLCVEFSVIFARQISNYVSERNIRLFIFRICMIADDINMSERQNVLTVAYNWKSSTFHLVIIKSHSTTH